MENDDDDRYTDIHIDKPLEDGVILERIFELEVATNVPRLVTYHSPTGFEWGYAGSGPAELALNIVEIALRRRGFDGPRVNEGTRWGGNPPDCYALTWALHQDFKGQVIAPMPQAGGTISWEAVNRWLERQAAERFNLKV